MTQWGDMHFQAIIIGGGPAGLACAAALAEEGRDTLLLERRNQIGPKVCAGGITWSGAARYIPGHVIERTFHEQHITSGLQKIVLKYAVPIVSTIDRKNLGQWMAARAKKAGAVLRTGEQVKGIEENRVRTGSRTYRFDYLIGADGSDSLVRRYLGLPTTRVGVGIQYHLQGGLPDMVWHLDPRLFKSGYGWIFPHRDTTSVGAYAWRRDMKPSALKAGLHQWMDRRNLSRRGLSPRAGLINFDYRGWRFGNFFLAGDAAGLASGITGEGIHSAIISGKLAACCITNQRETSPEMRLLLRKHRLHAKLLKLIGRNRFTLRVMPEMLIMALRLGLLDYRALELGSSPVSKS